MKITQAKIRYLLVSSNPPNTLQCELQRTPGVRRLKPDSFRALTLTVFVLGEVISPFWAASFSAIKQRT